MTARKGLGRGGPTGERPGTNVLPPLWPGITGPPGPDCTCSWAYNSTAGAMQVKVRSRSCPEHRPGDNPDVQQVIADLEAKAMAELSDVEKKELTAELIDQIDRVTGPE